MIIHGFKYFYNLIYVCFRDHPVHYNFINDIIQLYAMMRTKKHAYLVWVENEVEFTHIFEAAIEDLNEDLDQVKNGKFRFGIIYHENEHQSSV